VHAIKISVFSFHLDDASRTALFLWNAEQIGGVSDFSRFYISMQSIPAENTYSFRQKPVL